MIKDMESTYVPNERKNKWIKLKPEYVDGVGDDLDLVILGTQLILAKTLGASPVW
jgi:DNA ligase-4